IEDFDGGGEGRDHVAAQGQGVGCIMEQLMATRLRFEHEREGGITARIDGGDMVHLDRDFKLHLVSQLASKALMTWRGHRPGARKITSKRQLAAAAAGWRICQYCAARTIRDVL